MTMERKKYLRPDMLTVCLNGCQPLMTGSVTVFDENAGQGIPGMAPPMENPVIDALINGNDPMKALIGM